MYSAHSLFEFKRTTHPFDGSLFTEALRNYVIAFSVLGNATLHRNKSKPPMHSSTDGHNAPFRKILNSAQCGRFTLIL